jgi:hypothetical protein
VDISGVPNLCFSYFLFFYFIEHRMRTIPVGTQNLLSEHTFLAPR